MSDNVNSPKHYTQGKIECIDYIQDKLTPEEFRGYIKGNVLKYVTREKHKNGDEDLKKARWYLDRLLTQSKTEKVGYKCITDKCKFFNDCEGRCVFEISHSTNEINRSMYMDCLIQYCPIWTGEGAK